MHVSQFSRNSEILRAFDIVRCRYNLPLRTVARAFNSSPGDQSTNSGTKLDQAFDPEAFYLDHMKTVDASGSQSFPTLPKESSASCHLEVESTSCCTPVIAGEPDSRFAKASGIVQQSPSTSAPRNRSSSALSCYLLGEPDDSNLEITASQLFWKDPRRANSDTDVINYSLPRRFTSNSQTPSSLPETSVARCFTDDVGLSAEPNPPRAMASRSISGCQQRKPPQHPSMPEWELFAFGDHTPNLRAKPRSSEREFYQVAYDAGHEVEATINRADPETALHGGVIWADGKWSPMRIRMERQHSSFASDRTLYDHPDLESAGNDDLAPDERMKPRPARRESEVWPLNQEMRQGS